MKKILILLILLTVCILHAGTVGFIPNRGQLANADAIQYYLPFEGGVIYFSNDRIDYVLKQNYALTQEGNNQFPNLHPQYKQSMRKVSLIYQHTSNLKYSTAGESIGEKLNFFKPSGTYKNIQRVSSFTVHNLYPGVDLVFSLVNNKLKSDYIIHPGGNIRDIQLKCTGAFNSISLENNNQIKIATDLGNWIEEIPNSYIKESGEKIDITYQLKDNILSFNSPDYDASHTLIIDPITHTYSTFLGGGNEELGLRTRILSDQIHAIIMGRVSSNDFPLANAFDTINNQPVYDVFVSKININNNNLIYSTYVGGSSADEPWDLALDVQEDVYVTGYNVGGNFPTTANAFQPNAAGLSDAFLFKLKNTGDSLVFSTYFGGSGDEYCYSIIVDIFNNNNIFIAGSSSSTNLPNVFGTLNGASDCFIAKFDSIGQSLTTKLFGGSSIDAINDITLSVNSVTGSNDNIAFTGETFSTDLPVTTSAFSNASGGGKDAVFGKYDFLNNNLEYLSYLGGSSFDAGISINSTPTDLFIVGNTTSPNFQTVNPLFASFFGGFNDIFAFRYNHFMNSVVYSTYFGSPGDDKVYDLVIDNQLNTIFIGYSDNSGYPVANTSYISHSGGLDMVFTSLNNTGNTINYSTYFGTSGDEIGFGIDIEGPKIATTGLTTSSAYPFLFGYDAVFNGPPNDAFLTIFEENPNLIAQNNAQQNWKIAKLEKGIYSINNLLNLPIHEISLWDIHGRQLSNIKVETSEFGGIVNLNSIPMGIYLIHVNAPLGFQTTFRIIND